jgi:hypothetical protein
MQYTATLNVFDKPEEAYCPTSISAETDDEALSLLVKWAEAECAGRGLHKAWLIFEDSTGKRQSEPIDLTGF